MSEQPNYFLDQLFRPSETDLFTLPDILLAMTVSTLLTFILASVYRYTHRGTSYSQSFLLTMFIMAISTAVVMMVIGSNIARAFSLVGALSVIRFRTPVKDPRDLAYLFAVVITGMGCGTGFYLASITMTAFIAIVAVTFYIANYGIKGKLECIFRVTYKVGQERLDRIEKQMGGYFSEFKLINRILDFGDDNATNVYVVRPGRATNIEDVEAELRKIDGVTALSLYQSDQHAPF